MTATWEIGEPCRDCEKRIEVGEWRFSPSENPAYSGPRWALCYDCLQVRARELDRRAAEQQP